jgi:autotransporter-associated beta strand protein
VGDGGGLGLWNVDSDTDWLDGGSASVFNNGDNVTFDNTSTNTTVDLAATFESPGSVTVNGNQNYTFTSSGKISGSGSVTDNNSGTLKVLTTNDYIGGTIINSGTVQVGNGTNGGAIGTGAVQDNGALVWDLPSGTQFMGAASGTGTLTLNGNGTVVLNGADTLAGATTITSGTLKQGVPNALPNGNGVGNIVVNGTLDLGGQNGTVNALTGSGAINSTVVGAPVLTVTGGGTYSGTIGNTAGALALVVNGSGHALELSGAGTYIGGTTVSAGTLQLGISSALGSGDVAVATGAILDLNSFSPTVGALNGGGTIFSTSTNTNGVTLTIGSDNNAGTFSGTIENGSGAGIVNLVMSGTGNETLTGSNTYSGSTTGSGTGTTGAGGLIIINPGGSINCGPLNGSGFVVSGGTLSSSGNSSLGQANNTFLQTSGTTFINAAIPSSTGSDGEFFEITGGTFSAGSLVLGRTANIANATAATPVNAATTTGFYINGAGVNATLGSLSIGTGNSAASARLDAGSLTVSNEVEVGFGNDRWTSFEINGGTFTNLDTVNGLVIAQNASAGEAYFNNGSTSFVQKISFGLATDTAVGTANGGSASTPEGFLYVNSNATLYIGSGGISKLNPHMTANNYGVELISGTLGAIANSVSGVNMNLEGTSNFNFQASDPSGNPWTMTLNGVISGTAAFVADGTGTVVLGGANTYTGGTTISNGIVSFVHGALAGTGGGVTLAGGTLQWQPGNSDDVSALGVTFSLPGGTLDANGNNVTLVNSIGNGGPGTLTVESTAPNGVLNLTGANTYTNNTIVESGTLEANSSSATGTGTVIVESGGTLGGAGTTGNVVVQTGGIISPGNNSVGTLNVGALTLDNGAIGDIEFGSGNDQITATSLKLTNAVFNIFVEGSTQPFSKQGTYTLITYSGPDPVLDSSWTTANTRNPHVGNAALTGIYSFTASGGSLRLNIIQNPALNVATWTAPSSGNWSGQNWSTDPTVPHAVGDTATFGVGTGSGVTTVTLDVNETDGELTFTNVNPFDIAASSPANTLTMNSGGGGASINVLAGVGNTITTPMALGDNMTVSVDSGDSLVLSGSIANSPSVTKTLTINGSGTTVISGANSYGPASGALGTTLSGGGTLQVGNNSALGAGNVSVTSSSTLQAGASVSLSNNISTGSSVTLTLDNNGSTLALGGAISGSGGLTEISAGKLALSGATSYTGPTIVSNGVLSLSGSATMAGTSIIELLSGDLLGNGTLSIAPKIAIGSTSLADTGTYTGLIDAAAGSVFTISGVISDPNSGTDNIEINSESGSTGTVVLGGANTFGPFNNFGTLQGGIVQIYNGLLEVGNTLALQSATLDYSSYGGSLIVASGVSNVTLGAIESTQSPIQNLALTNVSGKGITLTVNGNDNSTTYNGNFTDGGLGGSLTKNGLDTLGLTGTSSFAGTLTVTAGEVDLTGAITCSNVNTSGAGGAEMVVDFGATLIVTNTSTNGSIFATGSAPSLLVNGTAVFNGLIQQNSGNDVGGLIQANSGTLTCSNMLLSRGGADLTTQPTAGDTGDGLYVSGGSVVITNNLDMSSQAANNSTISTRIDSGSLTVGNSITIGLANGGRWSVLDVNGGTLTVTNITNGIFVGATNTGNAELLVRAGTATVGGILVGQGANTGEEAVVNVTGGALYMGSGGIVQAASGVGFVTSLIQLGNGILGATNSWSTAMPVSMTGTGSGGFQTSDMNGVPHNITLTGGANGTGVFGLNLTAVNSPAVGTLTLSGPETWSGGTIINGGTLALVGQDSAAGFLQDTTGVTNASPGVINATGLADGTLHIGDATIKQVAQTLSGNGTNIGNVFIGSKGTLAPGFPIGNISAFNQMPISSKLTVASNGAVVLNIDDQGSGPLNDSVNAASVAFQPDSSLVLNQGNNPLKAGDTFQLFNITGAGLSTATNLHLTLPTLTPDGTLAYAWNTSRLAVNGSITLTGVNPPSTSLSFGVTNGVITMSWPTLGSILQSNSISVTSTNWVNVSGSSNVTTENITINTGQSNVFFRLLQP